MGRISPLIFGYIFALLGLAIIFAFFDTAEAYSSKGWSVSPIGTVSGGQSFDGYDGTWHFGPSTSSTAPNCGVSGSRDPITFEYIAIGFNLFSDWNLGTDNDCLNAGTYYLVFSDNAPVTGPNYVYSVYYDGQYVVPIIGYASTTFALGGAYNTRFLDLTVSATSTGGGGGGTTMTASGWGSAPVNGEYTQGADINGYPSYQFSTYQICRYNTSHTWQFDDDGNCNDGEGSGPLYYSDDDVATPDLVSTWIINSGSSPTGTITAGGGGGGGTAGIEFTVSYYIDPAEVNRAISAYNPSHLKFQVAEQPDTTFTGYSYSIGSTTGTSTFSVVYSGSLTASSTYDLRVSFSNLSTLNGGDVPFENSYIYTSFSVDGDEEFLSQGDNEDYNGLNPPSFDLGDTLYGLGLVACPQLDIFCQLTNFGRWSTSNLFIPSAESIDFVLAQRSALMLKLPFSMFTDFTAAYDSAVSSHTSSSSSLSLHLYGEDIDVISTTTFSAVSGTNALSGLRYLETAALWIAFGWFVLHRIRKLFV